MKSGWDALKDIEAQPESLGAGFEPPPEAAILRPIAANGKLEVQVTFLEMLRPPAQPASAAPEPTAVVRVERPGVSFYRYLYDTVGAPWLWHERRALAEDELHRVINQAGVELFVLHARGVPAGYVELDRRQPAQVEVAYFGLVPAYIGRGLGAYFLRWSIERAWSAPDSGGAGPPARVWLHTCSLDHPNALGTYQRAGFSIYDRRTVVIDDPRQWVDFGFGPRGDSGRPG